MHWPDVIRTDRLNLRRPRASDAADLYDGYARDPDVVRYLMWRPHESVADTQTYLERVHTAWESGTEMTWVLTLGDEDRLVGMVALRPRGFKHDLGYVLARPYWGRGIMTEAARAMVNLSLEDPQVRRVWAVCDVDNTASARVMEKVGMTFEGVLRRWVIHPNVSPDPRDALCYALVR
jgi:RimJ/RimL family protein N-acetyltransferase